MIVVHSTSLLWPDQTGNNMVQQNQTLQPFALLTGHIVVGCSAAFASLQSHHQLATAGSRRCVQSGCQTSKQLRPTHFESAATEVAN